MLLYHASSYLRHTLLIACSVLTLHADAATKQRFFCGLQGNTATVLCPKIDEIAFNARSRRWDSKTGWESEESTIGDSLKTFIGAQWTGFETGEVVCVYTTKASQGFPVTLSAAVTIRNPLRTINSSPLFEKSNWKQKKNVNLQLRAECLSDRNEPCDCPFDVFIQQQQSTSELLQGIKKIPGGTAVFEFNWGDLKK